MPDEITALRDLQTAVAHFIWATQTAEDNPGTRFTPRAGAAYGVLVVAHNVLEKMAREKAAKER